MIENFQGEVDESLVPGDNHFSAENYRVIHFVADVPVRVPAHLIESAPPGCEALGPVVFVLCEFQMLDAETDANNEVGDASHAAYKQRQRQAVYNRLRLGARQSLADRDSPSGTSSAPPPESESKEDD